MIITLKDLLGSHKLEGLPKDHQGNLFNLLEKINKITFFDDSLSVSSGYRSMADHLRIYAEKGITDKAKIPMKSKHLSGMAVDIADPKGKLQAWCTANAKELERIGLWCEKFSYTPGWVHFQTAAPGSGDRFFAPY